MNGLFRQSGGFTILELIVAISVSTVIILMTTQVFIEGIKNTRATASESRLVSAGAYIIDVLANHIRQADSVTLLGASELQVINNAGLIRIISLDNKTIEVDGQPIHSSLISAEALSFSIIDNSVGIQYQLNTRFAERPLVVNTIVTPRN